MKPVIRDEKKLTLNKEGPFPAKILLSKADTNAASVKKGILEKGETIAVHMHTECNQMEYYFKGKALMYIEGLDKVVIQRGSFTYIPKGTKHSILKVYESLEMITVFIPPLF